MAGLAKPHFVITGAGSGIGRACAIALAQANVRLTLLGRREAALQETQAQLTNAAQHQCIVCDVSDEASVKKSFAHAKRGEGIVNGLINNAGAAHSAKFLDTDLNTWQAMMGVNLTGAFLCTQAVIPDMLASGSGRIVNIASTAALVGYPYVSAYVAAKHGLLGLTRALALEYIGKNILINAVCPGFTETELVQRSIENITSNTGKTQDEARENLSQFNPQKRLIAPQEVAATVYWLSLTAPAAITGQALSVSGGEVML